MVFSISSAPAHCYLRGNRGQLQLDIGRRGLANQEVQVGFFGGRESGSRNGERVAAGYKLRELVLASTAGSGFALGTCGLKRESDLSVGNDGFAAVGDPPIQRGGRPTPKTCWTRRQTTWAEGIALERLLDGSRRGS